MREWWKGLLGDNGEAGGICEGAMGNRDGTAVEKRAGIVREPWRSPEGAVMEPLWRNGREA